MSLNRNELLYEKGERDMKKIAKLFVTVSLLLLLIPSVTARETLTVELLSARVPTEYLLSEVIVEYTEDLENNKYIAEIIDKKTGEVVETYFEEPEISIVELKNLNKGYGKQRNSSTTYSTTWTTYKTLATVDGQTIDAKVVVRVNITGGTYWRQVNAVEDYRHGPGSSGAYDLINTGTYWQIEDLPFSGTLQIDIDGTIQITSQHSYGWDMELLPNFGFTLSGSETSTWYARRDYNTSAFFEVMP